MALTHTLTDAKTVAQNATDVTYSCTCTLYNDKQEQVGSAVELAFTVNAGNVNKQSIVAGAFAQQIADLKAQTQMALDANTAIGTGLTALIDGLLEA